MISKSSINKKKEFVWVLILEKTIQYHSNASNLQINMNELLDYTRIVYSCIVQKCPTCYSPLNMKKSRYEVYVWNWHHYGK